MIVLDLGRGGFGDGRGCAATELQCLQCSQWGTTEENELRYSEAVDKVRETGGSRMIIGDILCLFAYISCPLLLLALECWNHPQIDKADEG